MSLVFGIFNRDGKPVDQDDLNLMYEAVNHLLS